MPRAGVEPARDCSRGILSPLRLPIPPPGLKKNLSKFEEYLVFGEDIYAIYFILKSPFV